MWHRADKPKKKPFSSMNEDNLHNPEPEQPDNGPASKKCAGHHTSSLWELFTEDVDPQHQTRSIFCNLLYSTRSLSKWKITFSNVPCFLNLWWKWMKTLIHSGSRSHYQTRNSSLAADVNSSGWHWLGSHWWWWRPQWGQMHSWWKCFSNGSWWMRHCSTG